MRLKSPTKQLTANKDVARELDRFLGMNGLNRRLLRHYRHVLRQDSEGFARSFYAYLRAFPATAEVLEKFRQRGGKDEDLLRRQTEHLSGLLDAEIGVKSARRMIDVGTIHHRHGVEPAWMLGAYLFYLDHLRNLIHKSPAIEDRHRLALDASVTKLLFRDMGLALQGYWSANTHQLKLEQAKVTALQAQTTSLLSNIPQVLWSVDVASNEALYVSPTAEEVCYMDAGLPIPCLGWTLPEDGKKVRLAWRQALAGERTEVESRLRRPNGDMRWFRRMFYPFSGPDGKVIRVDGVMEDITETKSMVEQLKRLATTDTLTHLPNRALFQDRLNQAIASATRTGGEFVLMLLDLDHFKEINDTLGHPAGDQVLVLVAQRLRTVLRNTDTLARLGGDEFAILLTDICKGRDAAEKFIRKMTTSLTIPFHIGDNELFLRAGVGIVIFPEHGEDAATLMSRADVAMYGTKNRDIDHLYYDAVLDPNVPRRLKLSNELRHAIERNELLLHYQPKVDFATRRVTGVEALIRWRHPKLGLLAPEDFIGMAERTGFIRPITYWAIETALRECKTAGCAETLPVAVNVPGRALRDPAFFERIQGVLANVAVPASALEIEVTENTLMLEVETVYPLLARLVGIGIRVAIDDFGTGYSSLTRLKRLPVHTLKIDKSFVLNMGRNGSDAAIVRSTVELGHNLGLRVVAEGVAERKVWDMLAALGCDDAQGFLISEPLSHAELVQWTKQEIRGVSEKLLTRKHQRYSSGDILPRRLE